MEEVSYDAISLALQIHWYEHIMFSLNGFLMVIAPTSSEAPKIIPLQHSGVMSLNVINIFQYVDEVTTLRFKTVVYKPSYSIAYAMASTPDIDHTQHLIPGPNENR